ncbi:hypothetical protein K1W54_22065 [Micromonospora sp. CPCC 205371]|nr:hypothetical protein [Micromonospora sp. CPCC 205371]
MRTPERYCPRPFDWPRDFVVSDPDGHRFTLGCGEQRLREVADRYGLTAETISVNPQWLRPSNPM